MAIYIDDVKVNKTELLRTLGVSSKDVPIIRRKAFEVVHKRPDRVNRGKYKFNRNLVFDPQFVAFSKEKGYNVRVRYAENVIPRNEGGKTINSFFPKYIRLDFGEDGTRPMWDKKDEEFLFLFLHPSNLNSPLRQPDSNAPAFYKFADPEGKSLEELKKEEWTINALQIIIGENRWSDEDLKILAKGMHITGVDDMTSGEIRVELKRRAMQDPVGFRNRAEGNQVKFDGTIQDAIDKNLLSIRTLNGLKRWYLRDEEILPLPAGVDPLIALKEHIVANIAVWWTKIVQAVDGKFLESEIEKADNDKYFKNKEVPAPVSKAEAGKELSDEMKKLQADEKLQKKIEELAQIDPDDPSVHWQKKKQYENHKDLIDAYKAQQADGAEDSSDDATGDGSEDEDSDEDIFGEGEE